MSLRTARFRVSPNILQPLGLEQLQDPALAVVELIKNSWDADADDVRVRIAVTEDTAVVLVSDNGSGMDAKQFVDRWLVLGDTHKRQAGITDSRRRPVIGEKGLGRLASFALGSLVRVTSKKSRKPAFSALIDWSMILRSKSLDEVPIKLAAADRERGTTVEITARPAKPWGARDTTLLRQHVEFLALPGAGDRFVVSVDAPDGRFVVEPRPDTIEQLAEVRLAVKVADSGEPQILEAIAGDKHYEGVAFSPLRSGKADPSLAGTVVKLLFFRRTAPKGSEILEADHARKLLEAYEGIRVFRDGLNVPPYGLGGGDWARLEKQRTATGGPTLVPGNSQLIGEVHLSRALHGHLKVTAGRAGFADQKAVESIAEYVRWSARAIGAVRRAAHFGVQRGAVPPRVDQSPSAARRSRPFIERLRELTRELRSISRAGVATPEALSTLLSASESALKEYAAELRTARVYAQLATAGASVASFAHELRKDFDVVNELVEEITQAKGSLSRNAQRHLAECWDTIHGFVTLFRLFPVKSRRASQIVGTQEVREGLGKVIEGIPHAGIDVKSTISLLKSMTLVPAELDSIILNLYTNAVKAVRENGRPEQGRIEIRISEEASDLRIEVLDNGVGVRSEDTEVIWQAGEGRFSEGTGMGLPICSFLARLYHGVVTYAPSQEAGFVTQFTAVLRGVFDAKEI